MSASSPLPDFTLTSLQPAFDSRYLSPFQSRIVSSVFRVLALIPHIFYFPVPVLCFYRTSTCDSIHIPSSSFACRMHNAIYVWPNHGLKSLSIIIGWKSIVWYHTLLGSHIRVPAIAISSLYNKFLVILLTNSKISSSYCFPLGLCLCATERLFMSLGMPAGRRQNKFAHLRSAARKHHFLLFMHFYFKGHWPDAFCQAEAESKAKASAKKYALRWNLGAYKLWVCSVMMQFYDGMMDGYWGKLNALFSCINFKFIYCAVLTAAQCNEQGSRWPINCILVGDLFHIDGKSSYLV